MKGATAYGSGNLVHRANFNPRAHEGRDLGNILKYAIRCKFQSTRPWRARHTTKQNNLQVKIFQSTRPWRARPHIPAREKKYNNERFQSTRPWRARLNQIKTSPFRSNNFNPRAHEGRDLKVSRPWARIGVDFNPRAHEGRDS